MTDSLINHPFRYGIFAFSILLSFFLIFFRKYDIPVNIESWGQLGDYIGGILNPVFGLISVVLVAATLKSQTQAAKIQAFESQFFTLLNLYSSIVENIDRKMEDKTFTVGRDCFRLFHKNISSKAKDGSKPIGAAYQDFIEANGWELEHYFRTVYHLFKHVKDGSEALKLDKLAKKKYYDLIKSQISQYELALLWLNIHGVHKGNWDLIINDPEAKPFEHLNRNNIT